MQSDLVDITLEEYLVTFQLEGVTDFTLSLKTDADFLIRPSQRNGQSLEFDITGNTVKCVTRSALCN